MKYIKQLIVFLTMAGLMFTGSAFAAATHATTSKNASIANKKLASSCVSCFYAKKVTPPPQTLKKK